MFESCSSTPTTTSITWIHASGRYVDLSPSSFSVPRTALHSDCALAPRSWGPRGPFASLAHLCAHELCVLHSSTAPRRDPPRGHRGRVARQGRHGVGLGRRAGGAEAIRTPRAPPTVSRGRRSQILVVRPSTLRLAAHTVAPEPVLEGVGKVRNASSEATGAVPRHAQRCTAPSRRRSIRQWCGKHLRQLATFVHTIRGRRRRLLQLQIEGGRRCSTARWPPPRTRAASARLRAVRASSPAVKAAIEVLWGGTKRRRHRGKGGAAVVGAIGGGEIAVLR